MPNFGEAFAIMCGILLFIVILPMLLLWFLKGLANKMEAWEKRVRIYREELEQRIKDKEQSSHE